jgi:hypothetical protein
MERELDEICGGRSMGKSKYRKLVDLYVTGTEFVFPDGTPAWLQVLNPFERETVRKDAQIARARIVLAMKEHGSDEQARIRAGFFAEGRETAVSQLVDVELGKTFGKVVDGLRNDPEWAERIEILDRGLDDAATPPTMEEELLLGKLQAEYFSEIGQRAETEKTFLQEKYDSLIEDDLWEAFLESWLERNGDQTAITHYKLGQIAFMTRVCEGVRNEDGWNHDACNSHLERVWDEVGEVRGLPEELQQELTAAVEAIELTDREAKNSDRQMSSSGSSQLPNEVEASTASTPIETPAVLPGISLPPSPMDSPSSGGSNSPTVTSLPASSG